MVELEFMYEYPKNIDSIKYFNEISDILIETRLPMYNGSTIETMPKLIENNLVPISFEEILKQNILNNQFEIKERNNYLRDSIIFHPNGKIKIALDSKNLRNINEGSNLDYNLLNLDYAGSLILTEKNYDETKGLEFTREEIEKINSLNLEEKINNPFWINLVRENKKLLKEYIAEINLFKEYIDLSNMMNIIIPLEAPKFIAEKHLVYNSDFRNIENLESGHLDNEDSILIGVPKNSSN